MVSLSSKEREVKILNENETRLKINIIFLPAFKSPNDCFIKVKWPVGCSKN